MKYNTFIRELILILITIIPILLLWQIWNQIPSEIPLHFNYKGEADAFGKKQTLLYLLPLTLQGTYLLLLFIPFVDPKKKIMHAGSSFFSIRLVVCLFLSAFFIVYLLGIKSGHGISGFFSIILLCFIILFGNYMPRLKPNYFVGIRTPWTLENAEVWRKTHRFSGKLWMISGIIVLLLYIVYYEQLDASLAIISIIILALISIIYSYFVYRKSTPG